MNIIDMRCGDRVVTEDGAEAVLLVAVPDDIPVMVVLDSGGQPAAVGIANPARLSWPR